MINLDNCNIVDLLNYFSDVGVEQPLKTRSRADYNLCSACGGIGSNAMTDTCGCAYGFYKAIKRMEKIFNESATEPAEVE